MEFKVSGINGQPQQIKKCYKLHIFIIAFKLYNNKNENHHLKLM